ncbi:uncharacterized protein LOC119309840 [Triticum dicoccoides]|uniref:uncharacterized protein LOC119309840 n=1 Tax=Triticum dicoccoides TaxID=85692 RepID=UPI001891C784|nr:uncharacterized protein LOC119309840 [Triticum dicoccoides]
MMLGKLWTKKKTAIWETEKRSLQDMIQGQQELINKCREKIDAWKEKEIYGEDLGEKNEMESKISQDNTPEDAYVEPVNYSASQDSVESLGTKLGIHKKEEGDKDKYKEGPARRSDRNLDKKDAKIEDLAKERAAEKDNYEKVPRGKNVDAGRKTHHASSK